VRDQRIEEARVLQQRLTPLARTIGTAHGVPALKAALDLLGYTGGPPRPPLRVAPSQVIDTLRSQLAALDALPLVH
jgi:dihydrodipicolinate synthase/N-acetylneuraminate lyase